MRKILLLIIVFLIPVQVSPAQDVPFQATHRGSIINLKFSPDGTKLVSYSSGNQDLALWNARSGRLIWKRPISFIQKADEYYTLFAFAWSPDQKFIATGGGNGTVQLWDAETGEFLWRADVHKKDVTALKFSPDGKTIASSALSGKSDSVKLIRADQGNLVKAFEGDPCTGVAIAFDDSGTKLRIGNLDGNITEWDTRSGKQINAEASAPCGVMRTYDWEGSFDDNLKISAGKINSDEVAIKDVQAGKTLKTIKANDSKVKTAVSNDAKKVIISEYGGFRYYDTETLEERQLDDPIGRSAFDLNNDGSLFARSCDGHMTAIKVTDLKDGRSWFLDGHPGNIHGISYSPDGKILAVAGGDGNIYFFDPTTRTLLKTLRGKGRGVTAIAFSPDTKILVSGDAVGGIGTWEVASGKLLNEDIAPPHGNNIEKLEFTGDGKSFSVLVNGSLSIRDVETLKPQGNILTREGYESSSGDLTITYTSVPVNSAVFTGDGKTVVAGHDDGTIRSWEAGTLEQLSSLQAAERVSFVTRVPSTNKIIVLAENKDKHHFELIDLKNMKVLARSGIIDSRYIETVSVSPDGKYVAAVDITGDADFWNLGDLSFVRRLDYGYSGGDTVTFSADGKTFFIGGENQNLFQYDTVTGKKLWQLLPSFQPGELEQKLDAESDVRLAKLKAIKARRDKQAVLDVAKYRAKVYITFEHYGDMSDPGEKRMMESDEPKESKAANAADESNAAWLRLHNDSPLPVKIPTESMYMPTGKCFHLFANGEKMHGLCDNREISIWLSVRDGAGKYVPYGFDFGSSVVLLPGTSALFPVPLSILEDGNSVVFGYSFQNVKASENDDDWNYGKKVELKFGMQNIPVKKRAKIR